MAEDHLKDLHKARVALVNKRLSWARIIATPGEIPDAAIKNIIEVQQAIEVIDIAIDELEEAEEDDDE
jgi:hypothetical protein